MDACSHHSLALPSAVIELHDVCPTSQVSTVAKDVVVLLVTPLATQDVSAAALCMTEHGSTGSSVLCFAHVASSWLSRSSQSFATEASAQSAIQAFIDAASTPLVTSHVSCDGRWNTWSQSLKEMVASHIARHDGCVRCIVIPCPPSTSLWREVRCTWQEWFLDQMHREGGVALVPICFPRTRPNVTTPRRTRRIFAVFSTDALFDNCAPAVVRFAENVVNGFLLSGSTSPCRVALHLIGLTTPPVSAEDMGLGAMNSSSSSSGVSWSEAYRRNMERGAQCLARVKQQLRILPPPSNTEGDCRWQCDEKVSILCASDAIAERMKEVCPRDSSAEDDVLVVVAKERSLLLSPSLSRWKSFVVRNETEAVLKRYGDTCDVAVVPTVN